MVFSSLTFLVFFFPVVLLLYFNWNNEKYKNIVLLFTSLIFYSWGEPKWIFVMLFTVVINYLCGIIISKSKKRKLFWVITGAGVSLAFLFYFKYTGFLLENVENIFGFESGFKAPVLPIGISFYTFQVLTYTVDVYRGKVEVQKNFFKLLLYVSFFPQLIAGPIVNYKDIEKSLGKRKIDIENFYQGFMRFLIGFSKKILIANTCGELVEKIVGTTSVAGTWLIALAYGLQIYFDFSGYSDMAIGIGRMFGFKFLENFNYPYISKSVTEFWRRWHISLGAFFREYVYIPMGGNRVSKAKLIRNIIFVWLLTGIWHGASWNFLIWGVYYGILLLIEKFVVLKIKDKLPSIINIIATLFFVLIGWVFFYYIDINEGIRHIKNMFGIDGIGLTDAKTIYYFKENIFFIVAGMLACIPWKLIIEKIFNGKEKALNVIASLALWIKPIMVTILFVCSVAMLVGQSYNPFLYFRF